MSMKVRFHVRGMMTGGLMLLAGSAAWAGDGPAVPAPAQNELERLRHSQEELAAKVEAQQHRIQELEEQASVNAGGLHAFLQTQDTGTSIEEILKKGLPTKKGSLFKVYGFVRLDTIWDDSTPSNTQTIGWIKSEDPSVTGGAKKNHQDFSMYPRLTRVGMELDAGKVESLDARVTGKIEVDFYNSGLTGQTESRSALRMRHAFVNLDFGNDALLAGQTSDLISPLYPIVNPDMIMWGAGNLGDRRPQVRFTHTTTAGNAKVTLAGMLGLTGAVDNQNLDTDGLRDGEASGLPTMQFRIGYATPVDGRSFEFGFWGHYAREATETPGTGEHNFQSTALGIDAMMPVTADLYVKGELWMGRNMDDVRGGIFQGIDAGTGNEVGSQGGFIETGYKVNKTLTVAVGAAEDNPDGGDLSVGGRIRNRVVYVGTRFNYDPIEFGIDFMHWHTQFKGQAGGLDNRLQAFIAYNF